MEYVLLKNSDLNVSRICMGGCPMGQYGWGEVKEQELIEAVNTAVDNGITIFDTADTYGLGKSEETLGKALGSRRKQVSIASKFGVRIEAGKTIYDNSPQWIQTSLENSLRRLKTDYIDLYQIHFRDGKTPLSDVIETLEFMKGKGYIRYYGLCNIHAADYMELSRYIGQFSSVQDEYSLACRKNEFDLSVLAEGLSVTPMTWGSLGQGILTGKYDENSYYAQDDRRNREAYVNFHGEKLLKNMQIVKSMRPIAEHHQVPMSAVAIRFILERIKQSVVLVGTKSSSQILDSIKALDWEMTDDEYLCLDTVSA